MRKVVWYIACLEGVVAAIHLYRAETVHGDRGITLLEKSILAAVLVQSGCVQVNVAKEPMMNRV